MRTITLLSILLLSCGVQQSSMLEGSGTARDRPNIVLFYADDLGWMDLAVQGSDFYETPHIDRIAREGMLFTRGYSNAGNCAPSRASLMTGMYTPRHRIFTVHDSFRGKSQNRQLIPIQTERVLDTSLLILPQYLKEKGYATCMAGKWHLSPNASDYGFDANFGGHQSGGPKSYFSPYRNPQLSDGPEGEHLPDRLSGEISNWITAQNSPFFVYFPLYSVHTPIQAREDLTTKYEEKAPGRFHDHPRYAAMIEAMDQAIGKVLSTLEDRGIIDETLIVFTSDNGGYGPVTSQRPLRGAKGMHYEGGIRVPFFVRWPGQVAAGSQTDYPVIGCDVFPTIADILGDRDLLDFDGRSFLPTLKGSQQSERALHWHFPAYLEMYRKDRAFEDSRDKPHWRSTPLAAIQRGSWKLMEFFESGELELYDLSRDPSESNNLAMAEPARVASLHAEMRKWRLETNAPVPRERNPEYRGPVRTSTGLVYEIMSRGKGQTAKVGQEVRIREETRYPSGKLIFSSDQIGGSLTFLLGGGQVIKGVEEGIVGMQEGEVRTLIVPPSLSQRKSYPDFLSPDSTLHYRIELLEVMEK
ncbi:MAG: sulfatase-like hydrolase/transferase [Saprospiraceae bacterium]|nr:sulfatase-like hydrolase/transferase [Saprospiraceae bacterium]